MTDIDALARRTTDDIAREWVLAGGEYNLLADIILGHMRHALREAHATGRTEGVAAGAQAMRERALYRVAYWFGDREKDSGFECCEEIRSLLLPDEKEKP